MVEFYPAEIYCSGTSKVRVCVRRHSSLGNYSSGLAVPADPLFSEEFKGTSKAFFTSEV